MTTLEILDRLQGDALKDGELRKKLLATRLEKDPLTVFADYAGNFGYELYGNGPGICRRRLLCYHAPPSTNGGGENSQAGGE